MMTLHSLLYIIAAYLLGSISSAIIICWLFRLPDPRTQGSHNPGATNVLRIGGKFPALLTLIGDMLKGVIAIILAKWLNLTVVEISLVMIAVFIGHIYPIFFKFKGGKALATALGAFIALSWQFGAVVIAAWLLLFGVTRISSAGALAVIVAAPIGAWFMLETSYFYAISFMVVILLIRHKDNIVRLYRGEEKKFG